MTWSLMGDSLQFGLMNQADAPAASRGDG